MTEPETADGPDRPELLCIYLTGGQVVEHVVTHWSLKKSSLTNELTELTWRGPGEVRLPFVKLDAVTAVQVRPLPASIDPMPAAQR